MDQRTESQTGKAVEDLLADSINEQSMMQSEVMHLEMEFGIRRCLPTLSDTRWLARIDSLSTLLHSYRAVCEALETVAEESTGQAASDASSYYNHITSFAFIVAAVVSQYLLGCIRSLSVALQSKSCDLLTAYEDANSLREVLNQQRTDEVFKKLYSKAVNIASDISVLPTKPRTTKRQTARDNPEVETIEEYYRVTCYFQFLDHIVGRLESRFSDDMKGVLLASYLMPNKASYISSEIMCSMKSEFADDLPSSETLEQELHRWCHRVRREDTAGITSITDIASILYAERDFFPNVNTMVQLLMTVPVGTCTCERSISGLRRLKTWTRTTMTSERLNGLALCFIHKDVDVDNASILSEWDKSGHRRIALAFKSETELETE